LRLLRPAFPEILCAGVRIHCHKGKESIVKLWETPVLRRRPRPHRLIPHGANPQWQTHAVAGKVAALDREAAGVAWLTSRVRGHARKFDVDDAWAGAAAELEVPGLDRPVLLRRRAYHDILKEILDAAGTVVDTIPASKRRGINRVTWSMRVPPPRVPKGAQAAFNASQGPRVLPGTYTVRLVVTNPYGESDVAETQVVVTDPDVHFASTTWCFANSGTPGGSGFEACPTQTPSRHVVIGASVNGGFDLALGALPDGSVTVQASDPPLELVLTREFAAIGTALARTALEQLRQADRIRALRRDWTY
jgi:hypothetical protein